MVVSRLFEIAVNNEQDIGPSDGLRESIRRQHQRRILIVDLFPLLEQSSMGHGQKITHRG
jgi:hypothetical protein